MYTNLSPPVEAIYFVSGENLTHITDDVCALSLVSNSILYRIPVDTFQIFTLRKKVKSDDLKGMQ